MIILDVKKCELSLKKNRVITLDEDTSKMLAIMSNKKKITARELSKQLYGSTIYFFRIWNNVKFLREYLNIYRGRNGYKLLDNIYITY